MASVRLRSDDGELARRVVAGDGAAFAMLDERHRGALTRYAGSLLRRCEHDAEDVVQDVLIRAHDALRAGERPEELRPWLYRLTRNRAIDEVRRARWGNEALDGESIVSRDDRADRASVLRDKESMRRLVEDLSDLPVRQRIALLGRELDDQSPEQVAAQLAVSVMAARKLAIRARENLIKTRDARDADCPVGEWPTDKARDEGDPLDRLVGVRERADPVANEGMRPVISQRRATRGHVPPLRLKLVGPCTHCSRSSRRERQRASLGGRSAVAWCSSVVRSYPPTPSTGAHLS